MKLCSACLLGINCLYNGEIKSDQKVLELAKKEILIPICPEQLGGLTTPRDAAENKDNKVFTKNGKDVTEQFTKGAQEVLKIVQLFGIEEAILKQRSPSCGYGKIYSGNFDGKIIDGDGITAKLLKENGIKIITEEDL
ncbi:MAG: DUF523 domain-containing protein [Candidatus Shapirobacteria bacterium]|nr:DUF523 domain-containing protein [Candidatus Shapirobacteria bacterium]MDD4410088.1 DUF523 domain-containing protein [Candidatus Shapirobacteria bacterium]